MIMGVPIRPACALRSRSNNMEIANFSPPILSGGGDRGFKSLGHSSCETAHLNARWAVSHDECPRDLNPLSPPPLRMGGLKLAISILLLRERNAQAGRIGTPMIIYHAHLVHARLRLPEQ